MCGYADVKIILTNSITLLITIGESRAAELINYATVLPV
jgi:hypothetical protein